MARGVYLIRHVASGRCYVGSSVNIHRRRRQHLRVLRLGQHPNAHLQAAWTRYGEPAFEFVTVEEVPAPGPLGEREAHWVERLGAMERNGGFNLREVGHEMPDEARAAISAAGRRKLSDEHRKAISRGRRGMKFDEAHRAAISRAKTGVKHGPAPETRRERLRQAQRRRLEREGPCPEERRARIANSVRRHLHEKPANKWGVTGITYAPKRKKPWTVRLKQDGKTRWIGAFATFDEAAAASAKAASALRAA